MTFLAPTTTTVTHTAPRLSPPIQSIFIDKRGIDVLLDMLMDPAVSHRSHREAAAALLQVRGSSVCVCVTWAGVGV